MFPSSALMVEGLVKCGGIRSKITILQPPSYKSHSNPILASSPIPQSASFGPGGLSSSLTVDGFKLPLRLVVPLLLKCPGLKPELLLLVLLTLSAYSGGGSEGLVKDVRVVSGVLLRVGVGEGVIWVLGEISTSSASRYHFLLLVYRPHAS